MSPQLQRPDAGFAGLPIQTDPSMIEADVAIVGVPFGWPYPRPGATAGCSMAPTAVRRRSARLAAFRGNWDFDLAAPMLPEDGPRIADAGDVPGDATDGARNSQRTQAVLGALLARGAVPICIGGDDSIPIPILRAFAARGPLTVLQVDAHLDFRDEVDGVREGYSSAMRRASEMSHVERIVQVGLRGVGSASPDDLRAAREAGNVVVTARELREGGVTAALRHVPADASVFLSLDLDGLDPSVAPGVSAAAPGGLTWDEITALVAGVGPRLVGAALTEYVPALDVNELTALVAARLMIIAAGSVTRG